MLTRVIIIEFIVGTTKI